RRARSRSARRIAGLRGAARAGAYQRCGERNETERGERRQRGAEREEQAPLRLPPAEDEPGEGEEDVDDREAERDVAEREDRHGERGCEAEPRVHSGGEPGRERERQRPARREEGE